MSLVKKIALKIAKIAEKHGICTVSYKSQEDSVNLLAISLVRQQVKLLMSDVEAMQLLYCLKATRDLRGSIAEIGCFEGGSVALMASFEHNKAIYAYDSFEGLPALGMVDSFFEPGNFTGVYEKTKNFLSQFRNIVLVKGMFPDCAFGIRHELFSLVNIDVDLYDGTRASLDFFYPRMILSGIMIVHDYPSSKGVEKAVNEFFYGKHEVVVKMAGNQAMIVKNI